MGFFSWECAECGGSIRNQYADDDARTKHRGITHVRPDGVVAGTYEGYGVVLGEDIYEWLGEGDRDLGISRQFDEDYHDLKIKVLHSDCYTGQKYKDLPESPVASDQGYW